MADRRRVRQVEVVAAARADLDVELHRLVAARALAFGFVLLAAGEDHRDQAEERQDGADRNQMKNELPFDLPMIAVARPKKKAMTRYSTSPLWRVRLGAVRPGGRRPGLRPSERPANPDLKAGAGAPTTMESPSGPAAAWPSRNQAELVQAEGTSKRRQAEARLEGQALALGRRPPTATGASRATSSSHKHKPKKHHFRGPGPKPPKRPPPRPAARRGAATAERRPRPPGAYQGAFGVAAGEPAAATAPASGRSPARPSSSSRWAWSARSSR